MAPRELSFDLAARRSRWIYGSLFAFLLLYVFPYQARLNNPNENVRVYMTAAIVELGTYQIDALRARWGYVNDAATRDGHVYSVKAPGSSWLGIPGYALYYAFSRAFDVSFDRTVALWMCRFTATIVPTWLWLMWLWRWLGRQTRHAPLRDAVLVSIGFGSLLYGYGLLFVSHTLSAAAAFTAFAGFLDLQRGTRALTTRTAFWLGTLSAWVTVLEYPGLVVSLALVIYGAWVIGRRREQLWFLLGGALPTLAMMHFQWSAFGSPFTPGHLMVENDAFRAAHEQGLYGAVGPSWSSLHGLLFDLGAGLFPLTPILVFALPGWFLMARDKREHAAGVWTSLGLSLLTVLTIASMNNWRGGWTIGPRYLAVIVPFMGWAALFALERLAARAPYLAYALAGGCAIAGLIASGAPSVYYPHLMPEITRPLPQIVGMLVAHDYAPSNLGQWLGVHGTASMVPLLIAALAVLWLSLRESGEAKRAWLAVIGGLAIGLLLVLPLTVRPAEEPGVAKARAFITRRWTPAGFDRAARLEAGLNPGSGSPKVAVDPLPRLQALADVYRSEGRDAEVARTERQIANLQRARSR